MDRRQLLFALLSTPALASARAIAQPAEPIVGLPCEGCEAAFDGRPHPLAGRTRIGPSDEPGEPLSLAGQVTDRAGRAQEGVIVYAYHTDRNGLYPPPELAISAAAGRHGRLRAWVQTDARGEYRFDTIRPGSYPGRDIPEHIHMHIIEPGRATYYIDDVVFHDDPKLTRDYIAQHSTGRGGNGIVTPQRRSGVWHVRRDVVLGRSVPGHHDSMSV